MFKATFEALDGPASGRVGWVVSAAWGRRFEARWNSPENRFLDVDLAAILFLECKSSTAFFEEFFSFFDMMVSWCHAIKTRLVSLFVKSRPIGVRPASSCCAVNASVASERVSAQRSLNLIDFVTLSGILSTTLADLLGMTSRVYAWIGRYYSMLREFVWGMGM